MASSSIFNVPYPRNQFFTGRTKILTAIHDHLVLQAPPDFTAICALHGLGGVGKTQIAIEYAYQHQHYFDVVYWLRANDWNTLVTSFVEMTRQNDSTSIGIPKFDRELENVVIAEQVKRWFESGISRQWLLILDNADKIDEGEELHSVTELVPKGRNGCILVTSRSVSSEREMARVGVEVKEMEESEAVNFLVSCVRQEDTNSLRKDATKLVQILGYFPLAIKQAGAFIQSSQNSIVRYISLYESIKSEALRSGLPVSHKHYYRHTVATTWKMSFDEVGNQNPRATVLLRLMGFLNGAKVPKELFEIGGRSLTDSSKCRLAGATRWKIEEAVISLLSYSLVRSIDSGESLNIHPLVQHVVFDYLNAEMIYGDWADLAVEIVCAAFPRDPSVGRNDSRF